MEDRVMCKKESHIVGTAILLMLIGLLSFPATGLAEDDSTLQGCSQQGSWFGYDADGLASWVDTIQGQSQLSGTVVLESVSFDLTLGGTFPTAARSTTARGTWKRTGPYTFSNSMIAFVVDENKTPVYIAKFIGTATLIDDCNTSYIEDTFEVFLPTQNPFVDKAQFEIILPGHYGYRMTMD